MKKWYIILTVLIIVLLVISCGPSAPPPELKDEQKNLAILSIKEYPEVRDAAVLQKGKELSLAVIVDYATSEARAREIGDSFVRLVKNFGPEPAPAKEIGKGTFDYMIAVAYPNEKIVVQGAKVSSADHITW